MERKGWEWRDLPSLPYFIYQLYILSCVFATTAECDLSVRMQISALATAEKEGQDLGSDRVLKWLEDCLMRPHSCQKEAYIF